MKKDHARAIKNPAYWQVLLSNVFFLKEVSGILK